MKGTLKSNTADRYLLPIREQIKELVRSDSVVVDFGCGTGDLLFQLAGKIHSGIGIDYSQSLIAYAQRRMEREQIGNLNFIQMDLNEHFPKNQADYAIASLFFHVLPRDCAHQLLKQMIGTYQTTIVCAFSKPGNWKQRFLLWLDQRFNRHYVHFKEYQYQGYMEGLLENIDSIQYTSYDTFDPVIKLYHITKNNI